MPRRAEIVIVGGGCIGSSIALHLSKRKLGKITVVERRGIASGATGMSSAIIRIRYWNEQTVRIALKARRIFSDFGNKIGGDCGFKRRGVLWLVGGNQVEQIKQNVKLVRSLGGEIEVLYGKDILEVEPLLSLDGIAAAAWEPQSGFADPILTTNTYVNEARKQGVEFLQYTSVQSIGVSSGKVSNLKTDKGIIETSKIVDAAGLWAGQISEMIGVSLPIRAKRVHLGLFRRPRGLGETSPVVSDFIQGDYFRPFGEGITKIGSSFQDNSLVSLNNIDISPSWDAVELMAKSFSKRFPSLAGSRYESGYSYAYDITPDYHPILDELTSSGVSGFYCAAGFSGHGFKESPVIGEMMADLIAEGRKGGSADLPFFRFSRFSERDLIKSPFPGG